MEPNIPEENPAPAPGKHQELRREAWELAKLAALFLVLFLGLRAFVIEGYQVHGDSMSPIVEDGERILVFKLPQQLSKLPLLHGVQPLSKGDLVVFDSEDDADKRYIKRIIAQGPQPQKSDGVAAETAVSLVPSVQVEFVNGKVYVGNALMDEPYLVDAERKSHERGKTMLRPGEYYVLGDHRSVSKDSRSFGPVKKRQIIGRAFLRIWPLNKFALL